MSFMEMNVNWSYPTDIRFGQGRLSELVAVCEDGTFTLNRKSYEIPRLIDNVRKKVIRKVNKGEQGMVFVDAHPEVEYDNIIAVMDAVREAGNQAELTVKVGIASLKSAEDFTACTPLPPKAPTPVAPAAPAPGALPFAVPGALPFHACERVPRLPPWALLVCDMEGDFSPSLSPWDEVEVFCLFTFLNLLSCFFGASYFFFGSPAPLISQDRD